MSIKLGAHQLALWLHTARSDKPLSSLDANIRCGNSLIGSDFYKGQVDLNLYDEVEKERVNAFDWETEFLEVFDRENKLSGFDAVIGNPPYVKFQNFRKIHPDMTEYLRNGRDDPDGKLFKGYKSAKTGNFDLFIPFIEKGITLLNSKGKLGYIAPNVWVAVDYGLGLRNWLRDSHFLSGWVDFKAHQIFDEATIYTSLQFFSKAPNNSVQVSIVPDGEMPMDIWEENGKLDYDQLDFGKRWLLLSGKEKKVIKKLEKSSNPLGATSSSKKIFVGIQTSADFIYHLKKLSPGRYVTKGKNGYEVELEDQLMMPLVSGEHAKRYTKPLTATYLLFPYKVKEDNSKLISANEMKDAYPKTWKYLKSYEADLRARENRKMDSDENWWAYNYPKNLTIQETPKLIVGQTVPNLRVCADWEGEVYLNNVRVNGVLAQDKQQLGFLLGVLNSPPCNFVFTRTAKPKDNSYYEANKQFISPMPIPKATASNKTLIAGKAEKLQSYHSQRRDIIALLSRRLLSTPTKLFPYSFIFTSIKSYEVLLEEASDSLDFNEKNRWAKAEYQAQIEAEYDKITERLHPDCVIQSEFLDGELSLKIDDISVLDGIFLDDSEGNFIAAQWNVVGSTLSITAKTNGKKLCNEIRKLVVTDNQALIKQIIKYQEQLAAIEDKIIEKEAEINAEVYKLYKLSDKEIAMVEAG